MTRRYKIIPGSQSGHCCFEFTVVDTDRPWFNARGEPFTDEGEQLYEAICECYDEADAKRVCDALCICDTLDATTP